MTGAACFRLSALSEAEATKSQNDPTTLLLHPLCRGLVCSNEQFSQPLLGANNLSGIIQTDGVAGSGIHFAPFSVYFRTGECVVQSSTALSDKSI